MTKLPKIIPITNLRQEAAEVLQSVQSSQEPIVVTQRGRAAAVLLGIDAYERAQHERRILRLLARGEREIEEGAGHSLSSVLQEADAILESDD